MSRKIQVVGPFDKPKDSPEYYVRCRLGWGWEVRGHNHFVSLAFSSQQAAIEAVKSLTEKQEKKMTDVR